jgi:hypothetical protein
MTPPEIQALQAKLSKLGEVSGHAATEGVITAIANLEIAYQLAVRNEPWQGAEYNRGAGNMRDNIVALILQNPTTDLKVSAELSEIIKAIRALPLPKR